MAANADSVVVELIAKTEQLDKPVQQSAAQFDANMNKIAASATKAEAAVTRSSAARSAALQRESGQISQFSTMLSRDMDIVGAKMLSPSSPFVVPVKQAPQVSNAMRVMSVGGSLLSGVLGGTLLTAGVALIAMLVDLARKTGDESDEIRDLVEKLKEHARQSRLSEEADRIWSQTLDGLIERQKKLNDELGKRLTTQGQADEAALRQAQGDVTRLSGDIEAERAQNEALHRQIAAAKRAPAEGGNPDEIAANEAARVANIAQLESQLRKSDELLKKLTSSLSDAQSRITRGQIIAGEAQGNAVADLTEGAKQFAEQYANVLRTIQQGNPTLTPFSDKINSSASSLTKAANEAAAAGVDFSVVTNRVSGLDNKLNLGEITVKTYATEVRKLANELKAMTEAAKEAAKQDPVKNFKASVIGAEGVGPNRMGSSAAGFGQFMPSTWESYFKRLFPDQSASLSTKQIDDLRNKRQIAEAVIDAATDDYVKVLKSAGVKVTEASLYTVHLLGEPAARKFFAAPAAASTQSVLGKGVVDVNPFLKGTVANARAAIAKRIGDSSAAISQGAAALAQTLQQEAEEEKQRSARYQQQKAELEGQVVDARGALAVSAQQTADIETLAVEVARQAYARNVDRDVEAGRLRADDAIELKKINDERAKLRQQLVDQRLRQAQTAAAEAGYARGRDYQSASYEAEAEYLHSVEALAKSSSDRRAIEQRLIDLEFAEEKLKNQYVIDWAERVRLNKDATDKEKADAALAAQIAKMHQATADDRHANATYGNQQSNASPLQDYFNQIPDKASEINDAFESIAVHGLATFNDALTNAIVHFTSLRDVARTVLQTIAADMIKLALQQIELHTIGAALGAASTATTTALAAAAGAAWAGPAAMASLATLGTNAGPAAAALSSTVALATILGAPKAVGGRIFGPGSDTSDNILTPSSPGEFMIRASSARSIGYDALEYMNQAGEMPGGLAMGGPVRPINATASRGGSGGGLDRADIGRLETAIRESQQSISLYASLDPVDMLQRALGRPAGHRALMAHLGNNATAVKATLDRP